MVGKAEFAYNNKAHSSTRMSPFKAALSKMQEEMKKYADRKRVEVDKYKVGDLVMLST